MIDIAAFIPDPAERERAVDAFVDDVVTVIWHVGRDIDDGEYGWTTALDRMAASVVRHEMPDADVLRRITEYALAVLVSKAKFSTLTAEETHVLDVATRLLDAIEATDAHH